MRFSWNNTEQEAVKGYQIFRSNTAEGEFRMIGTTPYRKFEDTPLEDGKEYFYKIKKIYATGLESDFSNTFSCNTDAQPLSAEVAQRHLVDHLTHPVRFEQSVQALADQGADVFAEVGFGGVLSNLVKRIDRKAARPCIQDAASFDAFVSEYAEDKE